MTSVPRLRGILRERDQLGEDLAALDRDIGVAVVDQPVLGANYCGSMEPMSCSCT
jgi:hypothetical protein